MELMPLVIAQVSPTRASASFGRIAAVKPTGRRPPGRLCGNQPSSAVRTSALGDGRLSEQAVLPAPQGLLVGKALKADTFDPSGGGMTSKPELKLPHVAASLTDTPFSRRGCGDDEVGALEP